MSQKDIKKGIAIQAKADAAHEEKLANALEKVSDQVSTIAEGLTADSEILGIVLDDIAQAEAYQKYGLVPKKKAYEMDDMEKRLLCKCVYSLLIDYNQNSELQKSFYEKLEIFLGISERISGFDFNSLCNVDSHTDRLCIAETICDFLYLNNCSFAFTGTPELIGCMEDFISDKELNFLYGNIEKQVNALGAESLISKYSHITEPAQAVSSDTKSAESINDDYDNSGVAREISDNSTGDNAGDFTLLKTIIDNHISNSEDFGKRVENVADVIKYNLNNDFPDLSYDSVIGITTIKNGYLVFTTFAMYLRDINANKGKYVCRIQPGIHLITPVKIWR